MYRLRAHIIKPGLFTTIQDEGRYDHMEIGIPIGGAMDKEAMFMANRLVENPDHTPVLEFTMKGPLIRFEGSGMIALAGAPFKVTLNGESIDFYENHEIQDGDLLEIKEALTGCRGYMSIKGDWQDQPWLGSYSCPSIYMNDFGLETHLKSGRVIEATTSSIVPKTSIPAHKRPFFSDCTIIRTVTSPDFEMFDAELIEEFYESVFTISNDTNRMGCRLHQNLKSYRQQVELLSTGIVPGTIQITNSGQPLILTADAQTTGGYPRIANIIAEDLSLVGQLRPKAQVKFNLVGLETN